MATAFSRTLRSLRADGFGRSALALLLAALFVAGWAAWSVLARVTLYEISSNARIEVDRAIYPIQSPLLGRVVRTIFLLEYISDDALRQVIQAAQNKCEGFNNFAQWAYFGSDIIEENVREDQLKIIKYNHLIANLMIFHNCHTMTQALKELEAEGMKLTPELAAAFSPYRTHHANRFGTYELRERDLEPIDYGVTFQM